MDCDAFQYKYKTIVLSHSTTVPMEVIIILYFYQLDRRNKTNQISTDMLYLWMITSVTRMPFCIWQFHKEPYSVT